MSSTSRASILSCALAVLSFASAQAATDKSAQASDSPAATEQLQEVTVTAQRAKLAQRIRKFVNQIATEEDGGEAGLARWDSPPVCPQVSGLTRRDGEFILERLSDVAQEAGVPLADAKCRPNLYVLVTPQPVKLLRGMEKRDRAYTFGFDVSYNIETPEAAVNEFIDTPRAVRAWYDTDGRDRWGGPLHYCAAWEAEGCQYPGAPHCMVDPSQQFLCSRATSGGTRLWAEIVWSFSRVFVVIDSTRLNGVKLGQLADYVAMVGFAKLNPGARLGNAPTILTLFNGAAQTAPTGLTAWDRAFLKAVYSTEQTSRQQQRQVAGDMLRQMTH